VISKKYLKTKRKTLFGLRFFYLSRDRRKEGEGGSRKKKQRRGNALNRTNSNLPGESIAREKEYCFRKQGKITPLLQKTIPEIEKRKGKHNTQKITKI
jgi:hypothetical protein